MTRETILPNFVGFAKSFKVKSDRTSVDVDTGEVDDEGSVTLNAEYGFGNFGDAVRFGISRDDPDGSMSYMSYSVGANLDGNRTSISTSRKRRI